MLREIAGKPLIGLVYEAVRSSPLLADVIIATDSAEIMEVCRKRGWKAQITSSEHRSGTERVHEVSKSVVADVYVNVQGDEPLTRAEHIATLLEVMKNPSVTVGTVMTSAGAADISNPNAVKVVTDLYVRALYFSRATLPFDRDGTQPRYYKHLGVYAYREAALNRFVSLPESMLEQSERLEQLASERAARDELERAAREEGMRSMWEDGIWKVAAGVTSVEELARVCTV